MAKKGTHRTMTADEADQLTRSQRQASADRACTMAKEMIPEVMGKIEAAAGRGENRVILRVDDGGCTIPESSRVKVLDALSPMLKKLGYRCSYRAHHNVVRDKKFQGWSNKNQDFESPQRIYVIEWGRP